jgi:hypothetical protein
MVVPACVCSRISWFSPIRNGSAGLSDTGRKRSQWCQHSKWEWREGGLPCPHVRFPARHTLNPISQPAFQATKSAVCDCCVST